MCDVEERSEAGGSNSSSIKSYFQLRGVEDYIEKASTGEGYVVEQFVKGWIFYVLGAILLPTTNQYVHAKHCKNRQIPDLNWIERILIPKKNVHIGLKKISP